MARKLRIAYPGALYHVINRGNYRRDVFETTGAAEAFLRVLAEATAIYGWRIHAYVLMRNHYHFALETPQPNLVGGMHWLQSTLATRFNRFRQESGHLFQGRYQALLIENNDALCRVVDYIHLNPVRVGLLAPEQVAGFRWSSLRRFIKNDRFPGLIAADWLEHRTLADDTAGWRDYVQHLVELAADVSRQKELGFETLSKGWAIGTRGWAEAVAKDHAQHALSPGLAAEAAPRLATQAQSSRIKPAPRAKGLTMLLITASLTSTSGTPVCHRTQSDPMFEASVGCPVVNATKASPDVGSILTELLIAGSFTPSWP